MVEEDNIRRIIEVETPSYSKLDKFAQFLTAYQIRYVDYIGNFYTRFNKDFSPTSARSSILNRKNGKPGLFCHVTNLVYSPGEYHEYMMLQNNGECKLVDKFSPSDPLIIVTKHEDWNLSDIDRRVLDAIEKEEEKRKTS